MSAVLTLATPPVSHTVAPPTPTPVRVWQTGPDVQLWVERSDGTRLDEIRDPLDPSDVDMRRQGVGGFETDVSFGDPGIGPLLVGHERPVRWDKEDVELAWYRQGRLVDRGPVVDARHRRGRLWVRAQSDEAYLAEQLIGSEESRNWLPQGDRPWPMIGWSTDPGVTVTEEDDDPWDDHSGVRLRTSFADGRGTTARAELPVGRTKNYAYVVMRVMVEPGAVMPYGLGVGRVQHYVGPPYGSGAFPSRGEPYALVLPDDYEPGTWATVVVPVPQVANMRNRYMVTRCAGTNGGAVFGPVRVERDENVSALRHQDVGVLMASLYQHLIGLMGPDRWGRRNAEVGQALQDTARYLARSHISAQSILDEHAAAGGDWWVDHDSTAHKKILCFGPRGRLVDELEVTSDTLDDWETRWDATQARNVGIYGSPDLDGPGREEYGARRGGAGPHRLPKAVIAPWGMSQRELRRWGDADLADSGAVMEVSGVPYGLDGSDLPGDVLEVLGLADRVRARIYDRPHPDWAWLDYTRTLAVDSLTWSPVTDRVRPKWAVIA